MSYDAAWPPNYRDVAVSTQSTAVMRTGLIFRSAQFYTALHLRKMNVKTVVDVRRPTPSAADGVDGVCHLQHNFVPNGTTGWRTVFLMPPCGTHSLARICVWPFDAKKVIVQGLMTDNERLCKFYWLVLSYSALEIKEAVRVFATEANYPILIHCIHGKDRTGILVALIAMVCGADIDAVCDDYAASDGNLQAAFRAGAIPAHEAWLFEPADNEALRCTRTPRVVMHTTLARVESVHGSVPQYLLSIGVTQAELDAIQRNAGVAAPSAGGGAGRDEEGAALAEDAAALLAGPAAAEPEVASVAGAKVSSLCTVTFHANLAHNLTRSP